jgi:hypothetical protein
MKRGTGLRCRLMELMTGIYRCIGIYIYFLVDFIYLIDDRVCVWDGWYATTIVVSLVREFLPNRGSSPTHRLLFAPTNQYSCTIVTPHLETLIDQFDHPTPDYCSVDQSSDSYEPGIALFCRFYLLIRSSNQDFELKIPIGIWARWVLPLPRIRQSAENSSWRKTNLPPACQLWPRWPRSIIIFG